MPQIPGIISYSETGGTKLNYAPVEDITTDRDASEVNLTFGAVAEMSQTSIKTWVNINLGTDPHIADGYTAWGAVWKENTPTLPVIHRVDPGTLTVTFPIQVTDVQGGVQTLDFKSVHHSLMGGRGFVEVNITSGNTVLIDLYTTSNSVTDFTSDVTLCLWII